MNGIALGGVLAVLIGLAFWSLFQKAMTPGRGEIDASRISGFSVADYSPMTRLLAEADVEFLTGQPGYEPGMGKKLLAARRSVFRAYLKSLRQDFQMLHRAARILVANAPKDQPELAGALLRQSLCFQAAMVWVHVQLGMHALGLAGVHVNATAILGSARRMQERMQALVASASPAAAA